LRKRSVNKLDWEHLAEEIEGLSGSDRQQIGNRLTRICEHLLKLAYLPDHYPRRRWRVTIIEQRQRIARLIEQSPSLRDYPATEFAKAYTDGRALVAEYTDALPETCPWTVEQVLEANFWPSTSPETDF
jgi:hypothetical protein